MISLNRTHHQPIGLHLGSRTATLVQLAGSPGSWQVYAMAHGAIPVLQDASSEEQDRETASALHKLIVDHHFKGRQVVSCLGSQELFVQNVRLPKLPPEEIEKVVTWEAEERLPYPIADAEIRYIPAGQVRQDANIKQEVILLACHQGVVKRHVGILEQAGLEAVAIDVEPCAVLRSLKGRAHPEADSPERYAFLNLGEQASTVMFAEGEQMLFLKYIQAGSAQLDHAVSRYLELSVEEAAKMRAVVNASVILDAEDEIHRSVIEAIRGPLDEMANEIELCLRYHKVTFRGKPLEKMIVTGAEATPWLIDYLQARLGLPCELGNPLDSLTAWPKSHRDWERPGRWSTAFGLSMKT